MNHCSSLWTQSATKQDDPECHLCGVSQHSFGIVHGFVLCLLLKKLSKKTREGNCTDGAGLSTDTLRLTPSSKQSCHTHRDGGDVYSAEVKEEMVPEVMVPEVMVPKVMVPEVIAPEVMVPKVMVPKVMVPDVQTEDQASALSAGSVAVRDRFFGDATTDCQQSTEDQVVQHLTGAGSVRDRFLGDATTDCQLSTEDKVALHLTGVRSVRDATTHSHPPTVKDVAPHMTGARYVRDATTHSHPPTVEDIAPHTTEARCVRDRSPGKATTHSQPPTVDDLSEGEKHVPLPSFYLPLSDGSENNDEDFGSSGEPVPGTTKEFDGRDCERPSLTDSAHVRRKRQLPARSRAAGHVKKKSRRRQNMGTRRSNSRAVSKSTTTVEQTLNTPPTVEQTSNTTPTGTAVGEAEPLSVSQTHACTKCNKTFTTERSLKRHAIKLHGRGREGVALTPTKAATDRPRQAQCDKCPKVYTGGRAEKNLQLHVLAFHGEGTPVQCDVCDVTLNNHHHLKLHKRSSHRKAVCYICGAHFVTQVGLQTHLLAHKGDKTYVCEICGAAFVRVSSLRQHTKFHTESRDFKCGMCPLSFKTFSSLSIHLMCVHQCGGYFSGQVQKVAALGYSIDADSLQRVHNQQCVTCGHGLVNNACPSHSTDCMLTFSCPQCHWTTKDIQKFRKHLVHRNSAACTTPEAGRRCGGLMEKNRPVAKNFICPSCGKRFYTQSHLQAHKHQHAEKRFSCPVCDKSFTYKFNMQNHLTTHTDARPFQCPVCHKTFKMKSQLQLHQRYHDGEFTCEVCGKILTRKQHVVNHYKLVHPERNLAE